MAEKINKQKKIQFLNTELEAVRTLPDVYIGALGDRGFINMYREILQNSLDEIIKGNTLDMEIVVSYDARTNTVIIEDNGQGIALDVLDRVFAVLHSSSNYNKKEGSGEYSSGKNGMGATITNFLSRFFVVESYRMDGTAAKVEFSEGVLSDKGIQPLKPKDIKAKRTGHGVITSFAPTAMMGNITVTPEQLYNLSWLIAHLCKIGTKIEFNSIDESGAKHKSIIQNKNGIFELLDSVCEKKIFQPIYFCVDNGTMKIETLLTYDVGLMDDPNILGFANMCPSYTGTHVDGFMSGVVKYFKDYMNKIYLANNKKLTVNINDIKTGLRAVVSVFHIKPLFTGKICASSLW